jgi:transcriptional regulator with XRE-family HTH domain
MINRKLIEARKAKGWTQACLAAQLAVSSLTISRWENGVQVPRAYCVQQLCRIFGMTEKELGLVPGQERLSQEDSMTGEKQSFPPVASSGLFQIGTRRGTWFPLDGDGTVEYRLENITTHYIPSVEELPEELLRRKEQIAQEHQRRREQGLPFAWNGDIYNLARFVIGREPVHEEMTLDLWFRPSDYYTFLATNRGLDDPTLRMKYLKEPNWYEPIPFFSHSFGIALVVVTKDGYCLPTQRSSYQAIQANIYSTAAVVESLSRPVDKRTDSFAPDLYRCACRGLSEELGLIEHVDFLPRDVLFLNFGVNTANALWALKGMVRVQRTCQEIMDRWSKGVKDKLENQKLYPLPFTPEDYVQFITEYRIVGENLYYALVHEFGREKVERVLSSYDASTGK